MAIAFKCDHCGADFQVPNYLGTRTFKCYKCRQLFTVPSTPNVMTQLKTEPAAAGSGFTALGMGAAVAGVVGTAAVAAAPASNDRDLDEPGTLPLAGDSGGTGFTNLGSTTGSTGLSQTGSGTGLSQSDSGTGLSQSGSGESIPAEPFSETAPLEPVLEGASSDSTASDVPLEAILEGDTSASGEVPLEPVLEEAPSSGDSSITLGEAEPLLMHEDQSGSVEMSGDTASTADEQLIDEILFEEESKG